MSRYCSFDECPPFPADVPTAQLAYVSLAKLKAGDKVESEALYKACQGAGFFRLQLEHDPSGEQLLEDVDKLMDVGEKLFDLPFEEKMKSVMGGTRGVFGYDFENPLQIILALS